MDEFKDSVKEYNNKNNWDNEGMHARNKSRVE